MKRLTGQVKRWAGQGALYFLGASSLFAQVDNSMPDGTQIKTYVLWILALILLVVDAIVAGSFLISIGRTAAEDRKSRGVQGIVTCVVLVLIEVIGLAFIYAKMATNISTFGSRFGG